MNVARLVIPVLGAVFFLVNVADADAATIRVRCEKRDHRSKVSVDGKNLDAGQYRALIKSGTETRKSPWQQTIDDEVEFDFDSDADDVAEGATRISQTFVKKKDGEGEDPRPRRIHRRQRHRDLPHPQVMEREVRPKPDARH